MCSSDLNPKEWNALKLLNNKGEFISGDEGKLILQMAESEAFEFSSVDKLGTIIANNQMLDAHINSILENKMVDIAAIENANFRIVFDAVNSTGAFAVPALLRRLGVKDIIIINEEVTGHFAHNPEPLQIGRAHV